MIRSGFSILLCVGLVGCATTPEQYARRANSLSSPSLCYIEYAGNNNDKVFASLELGRRHFDCTSQAIEMGRVEVNQRMANKAANDAASRALEMELGLRLLQPPPAPITCTTFGNVTTCR